MSSAISAPHLPRRAAGDVAEDPVELADAPETAAERDLGDGQAGLLQHLARLLDPVAVEVAREARPQRPSEQPRKVVRRQVLW